ncbi:MAG: ABC transporter permease [Dehalococcoidales bacterium]|nr:ABC transporter permease [Dehalococcoidales bacterium]
MAKNAVTSPEEPAGAVSITEAPHYSEFRRVIRVFFGRKIAVVGLVFIVLLIVTAIFAPLIAPYDPYKVNLRDKLLQPSTEHLLGTDAIGRDTLSRIVYGSRTSLMVGIGAIGISTLIGTFLGLCAAYFGGWTYNIIMRFTDALMAVPMIISAMIIAVLLGSGIKNVIFALAVGSIPHMVRMVCGQAMTVKQNDYILAGKVMGMSDMRMMLRQILPNAFPPILVMITIGLGSTILAEAALSFLGIGVPAEEPAWGGMVNDGYKYLLTHPILSFAPGFAIMLVVFGFNMVGDGLRDALDPRLRGAF